MHRLAFVASGIAGQALDIQELHQDDASYTDGHYLYINSSLTPVQQVDAVLFQSLLLRSGSLDKNGDIDKNAVLYYTQLGNAKGEPIINVALADRILYDHRVPPKGYLIEKYAFQIPTDATYPLTVKATLKYRSASQSLANKILGAAAPKIPVVDMVSLDDKIAL